MRISDWSSDVCSSDLYCQQIAPGNLLAAWEIYQPFPSDQAVTSGYSAADGNKGESEQQAMHKLHPREIACRVGGTLHASMEKYRFDDIKHEGESEPKAKNRVHQHIMAIGEATPKINQWTHPTPPPAIKR